jgi:hypothetical protein
MVWLRRVRRIAALDHGRGEDEHGEQVDRKDAEKAMHAGEIVQDVADRDADDDTQHRRDLECGHDADAAFLAATGDVRQKAQARRGGTGGGYPFQQPPAREHEDDPRFDQPRYL